MAAKPQKPPGISLKPLQNQHNSKNRNNEDNIATESNSSSTATTENGLVLHELGNLKTTTTNSNAECKSETAELLKKEINCNCSNISIMHLFHEMKQEFPTIPDTIVAQCVNENCHQRENCIQMLRNELELNPIPAQSYPAKVLHPRNNNNNNNSNNNNNNNNINNNHVNNTTIATTKPSTLQKPPLQQKPVIVQQKPPLKPIKPIRTAPLHPLLQQQQNNNDNLGKINTTITKNRGGGEDIRVGGGGDVTPQYKQSIFNTPSNTVNNTNLFEVNNNDNNSFADTVGVSAGNNVGVGESSVERNLPRQRPTTLNLNTQKQQQQQRQLLNIQLQQRFQEQRNKQLQQQTTQSTNNTYPTKPIRKAPLPPIAPKPAQFQINHNTNSYLNDSHSAFNHHTSTTSSPLSESEISVSVSLSTPSPTASSPSAHNNSNTIHHQRNTTTSTPTPTSTSTNQHQHSQTKSPIRHRSVITLQPEPPYTRGFLYSPATSTPTPPASPCLTAATPNAIQTTSATSSPTTSTSSVPGSQKSFTSVNLTLRPPVSPTGNNSALQPSTIDITAGPGFSGASSGGKSLHYRSTSYDARLGYEKNFQITVTDEGGVFSASRIRPQQAKQRCLNQQQQQQQQFHNNNVLALQQNIQNSIQSPQGGIGGVNTTVSGNGSSGCGGGSIGIGSVSRDNKSGNMCLPPQQTVDDLTAETLQRQKKRRDRLAEALRARKKTLSQVEQDINLLTGNIATEGLSEKLDEDIRKLRRDCEAMLRNSSNFSQPATEQELAINHQLQSQQQQQQQLYQQSQPFPRQRLGRPPPRPPPPRQSSLDIIQHHSPSSSSTPLTPPSASSPILSFHNTTTTQQQQQQQQSYHHPVTPSYYQQQSTLNPATGYSDQLYTDHDGRSMNNYLDEGEDEDSEDEEEMLEPWECIMCTFRNHPQLNICETCDNVRILPGTLPNLSNAFSAAANTAAAVAGGRSLNNANNSSSSSLNSSVSGGVGLNVANSNIEHDTNMVQQQLQHFALHT